MTNVELRQLVATARLGKVLRYRRFHAGQQNRTYVVTTSTGRYCVRVYRHKTLPELSFELALLNHVRGLPVPRPQRIGSQYYGMIGGQPAIIYRYIEGRQRQNLSLSQLFEIGQFLGRFHVRGRSFKWRGKRLRFYDLPPRRIAHIVRIAKRRGLSHLHLLPKLVHDLRKYAPHQSLPQGPIHVDVKPENVLFYRGRLSGVIDFDNSYIGPYLLDLATSMVWFGTRNTRFDLCAVAALYRGYIRTRRLTTLEYRELYRMLRYKFVSHVFVDYYMRASGVTTDGYFSWIIRNVYAAYKHFNAPREQFYQSLQTPGG